jgi:hypothetical protein
MEWEEWELVAAAVLLAMVGSWWLWRGSCWWLHDNAIIILATLFCRWGRGWE